MSVIVIIIYFICTSFLTLHLGLIFLFRYSPFGINGMFAGSAIVFFSYIGFDSVTSTAEEARNLSRQLHLLQYISHSLPRCIHVKSAIIMTHYESNTTILCVSVLLILQVKQPQRDLPLGIAIALSICCILYMLVSVVIVGLVPYYALDPDTPISSAFASYGVQWAV